MRPWVGRALVITAILALATVSVVASQERRRASLEREFDADHIIRRWQGPFTYTREFRAASPGCSYHGGETVDATLVCVGPDLGRLQCEARGTAAHTYSEAVEVNGTRRERTDVGRYQGLLRSDFTATMIKGWHLFNLDVGADIPVQYRRSDGAAATASGSYVLAVAGSTDPERFSPLADRLEWSRTDPIYEPGPAPCGGSGYNGTYKVSLRLLPTD